MLQYMTSVHIYEDLDCRTRYTKRTRKPLIQHMGNRACYNPRSDTVTLPLQTAFQSPEEYYSTAFHELTHSTMHEDRLNRKVTGQVHTFGDEEYSKEELVAECGASFLCGHAGIVQRTIENSAAYLAGWLKALKNDRTLLIHAAAQAQKASDYILNVKGGEESKAVDLDSEAYPTCNNPPRKPTLPRSNIYSDSHL